MKYLFLTFILLLIGKSSAQNHWQVSVSSGVVSPKFLIDTPLGYQIEGKIFYEFSDSLQLIISSGFNRWKEEISPGGNKFQTIPLLAGLKYLFPLGLFSPYFSGELGVHFINQEYTVETYKSSDRFVGVVELISSKPETESITTFAYRFSIGSSLSVSRNLDIDLCINYNGISYSFVYIYLPDRQISSKGMYFYSFSAGFNYKL